MTNLVKWFQEFRVYMMHIFVVAFLHVCPCRSSHFFFHARLRRTASIHLCISVFLNVRVGVYFSIFLFRVSPIQSRLSGDSLASV